MIVRFSLQPYPYVRTWLLMRVFLLLTACSPQGFQGRQAQTPNGPAFQATQQALPIIATQAPGLILSPLKNPVEIVVGPAIPDSGQDTHQDFSAALHPDNLASWNEVASKSTTFQIGAGYLGDLYLLNQKGLPSGKKLLEEFIRTLKLAKARYPWRKVSLGVQGIYYIPGYAGVSGCDPIKQGRAMYSNANPDNQAREGLSFYADVIRFYHDGGGDLDYVHFDNGIAAADPEGLCPSLSMRDRIVGLHTYYKELRDHLYPNLKMRITENIIRFDIRAPDGTLYPGLTGAWGQSRWNDRIPFDSVVETLKEVAGPDLDAVCMDSDGLHYDTLVQPLNSPYRVDDVGGLPNPDGLTPQLDSGLKSLAIDFGRVLGVEQALHRAQIKSGFYFAQTARRDLKDSATNPLRTRDYISRVTHQVRDYLKLGGQSDLIHFESWTEVPDRVGSESQPDTQLFMIRSQIRALLQQGPTRATETPTLFQIDPSINLSTLTLATNGLRNPASTDVRFDGESATWQLGSQSIGFGLKGDIPVPAQYNGALQLAVYRQSVGSFFVSINNKSFDGTNARHVFFGLPTDIPVPLRGSVDHLGVYRPSLGIYYINIDNLTLNAQGSNAMAVAVGSPGDLLLSAEHGSDGLIRFEIGLKTEDYLCVEMKTIVGAGSLSGLPMGTPLGAPTINCNHPTLNQRVRNFLSQGTPWSY